MKEVVTFTLYVLVVGLAMVGVVLFVTGLFAASVYFGWNLIVVPLYGAPHCPFIIALIFGMIFTSALIVGI